MWIISLFSLLLPLCRGVEDYFYLHVNMVRSDPDLYREQYGVEIRCSDPVGPLPPLYQHDCLRRGSEFQSWSLSFANCTEITHNTCPLYCHRFGGHCGYINRFDHFCPEHNVVIAEILIRGPRQAPRMFREFLRSPVHCDHLMDARIDTIGCSFQRHDRNIFTCDVAQLRPDTSEQHFITSLVEYNEQDNTSTIYVNSYAHEVWIVFPNTQEKLPMFLFFGRSFFMITIPFLVDSNTPYYFTDGLHRSS